jgi:hypothetical protein
MTPETSKINFTNQFLCSFSFLIASSEFHTYDRRSRFDIKTSQQEIIECHDDIVENYFLYLMHNKCYMYLL